MATKHMGSSEVHKSCFSNSYYALVFPDITIKMYTCKKSLFKSMLCLITKLNLMFRDDINYWKFSLKFLGQLSKLCEIID